MNVRRWSALQMDSRNFIRDMLPVVLGVLLALLINNLNESLKEKRRINEIRWQIYAEIATNLDFCKEFIKEQEARSTFFSEYSDSLGFFSNLGYSFKKLPYRGLRILSLSNTAWDAAQYSGVLSSMNFDELQGVAGIYHRQQFLLDLQKQFMSNFYNHDIYDPDLLKRTFYHFRQLNDDYIAFARSLILNYEYFLREYDPGQ